MIELEPLDPRFAGKSGSLPSRMVYDLARYLDGSYYPVDIGDVLGNGRYRVLYKMGCTSLTQAWVVRDLFAIDYVYMSLRIERAEVGELPFLLAMKKHYASHPGSDHVTKLLDHFTIQGPQGEFHAMVLELTSHNLRSIVEHTRYGARAEFPPSTACIASRHVAKGVSFLHSCGIGLGKGMTPYGIYLKAADFTGLTEEQLMQRLKEPARQKIMRADGAPNPPNLPRYVYDMKVIPASHDFTLGNFTYAFFFDKRPDRKMPVYGSWGSSSLIPELVFGASADQYDYRIDLFQLGATIHRFFSGVLPIARATPNASAWGLRRCGELPARIRSRVNFDKYYNPDGSVKASCYDGPDSTKECFLDCVPRRRDESSKTGDLLEAVGTVLESLLLNDPSARASAEAIAQNPAFDFGDVEHEKHANFVKQVDFEVFRCHLWYKGQLEKPFPKTIPDVNVKAQYYHIRGVYGTRYDV